MMVVLSIFVGRTLDAAVRGSRADLPVYSAVTSVCTGTQVACCPSHPLRARFLVLRSLPDSNVASHIERT